MQVDEVEQLTGGQLSEVLSLAGTAAHADKVSPLSEQVLMAARSDLPTSAHFLAYDGTHLAGYAHLDRGSAGQDGTAEVVVDPGHRRNGIGTRLIRALENAVQRDAVTFHPESEISRAEPVTLRLWAHGHLDGARALALRDGYSIVRELWQMRRPLPTDDDLPAVSLPEGYRTRRFVVGQDEDAWLRVNARAFVHHPEQGRMTREDLDQRIAEPWFDATGLILIEDTRGPVPVLAASHWTKVVPVADPNAIPTESVPVADPNAIPNEGEGEGEVYVVGVDPAYQGVGLGRAVTVLGLAHLRERGLTGAMLYVEADNHAAIATYSRLGFVRCGLDIMYSRIVHSPV